MMSTAVSLKFEILSHKNNDVHTEPEQKSSQPSVLTPAVASNRCLWQNIRAGQVPYNVS